MLAQQHLPPPRTEPGQLAPDLRHTRAFLAFLEPDRWQDTRFVFVRMRKPPGSPEGTPLEIAHEYLTYDGFTKTVQPNIDEHWNYFITINRTRGARRTTNDVTATRAYFVDFDEDKAWDAAGAPPDLVVQSKRGQHLYWRTSEGLDLLEEWVPTQKALIKRFGSDPQVCDLPRVMRLPGTWHLKDPSDPHMVRIVQRRDVPEVSRKRCAMLAQSLPLSIDWSEGGSANYAANTVPSKVKRMPRHLRDLFNLFEKQGKGTPIPVKDGWLLRCPGHPDSNPSMLVMLKETGVIRLCCRSQGKAGCTRDHILDQLGVGWGILYPYDQRDRDWDKDL